MTRNKFTPKEKLVIVKEYLSGNTLFMKLGNKYGIDKSSIRQWIAKYKSQWKHSGECLNQRCTI